MMQYNSCVCSNWWHNEIGVPKKYAAVMLMSVDGYCQSASPSRHLYLSDSEPAPYGEK